MENAVEAVAKIIFEEWGGPWRAAPEFRKVQARREALTVLEGLRSDETAARQVIAFIASTDMGDLSVAPEKETVVKSFAGAACSRCGGFGSHTRNDLAQHPDDVGRMYRCEACNGTGKAPPHKTA